MKNKKFIFTKKFIQRILLSLTNVARTILSSFIGLIINYLLIHNKPELFLNVYVQCFTLLNLISVLVNFTPKDYIVKSISQSPAQSKQIISDALTLKFLVIVFLVPFLFFLPNTTLVTFALIVLLILKSISTVVDVLVQIEKKFNQVFFLDFILGLTLICLLVFDENKSNVWLFVLELCVVELIRTIWMLYLFRKSLRFQLQFASFKTNFQQALPFFFTGIAGFAASKADLYTLGYMLSANELNRYYILLNLIVFCQIILNALVNTYAGNILRYNAHSYSHFEKMILKTGFPFSIIGAAAVLFIFYIYYHSAISLFAFVLISINLYSFCLTLLGVYSLTRQNQQALILKIIASAGILNVLFSIFFIKFLGFQGALLSNTFISVISGLSFKYLSSNRLIQAHSK